jgi:hypothetical protein
VWPDLPPGAPHPIQSDCTRNQAFQRGTALGLPYCKILVSLRGATIPRFRCGRAAPWA